MATTTDDIVRVLSGYFAGQGDVEMIEDRIRRENDWWYVPVRRKRAFARTFEYYDVLANLEERIEEEQDLNILLVPTAD